VRAPPPSVALAPTSAARGHGLQSPPRPASQVNVTPPKGIPPTAGAARGGTPSRRNPPVIQHGDHTGIPARSQHGKTRRRREPAAHGPFPAWDTYGIDDTSMTAPIAWSITGGAAFLHAVELQGDRPAHRKNSVDLRGNLYGLSDHSVVSGQVVRSHATVEREHRHVPGTRAQTCPRSAHVIGGVPWRRPPCRRRRRARWSSEASWSSVARASGPLGRARHGDRGRLGCLGQPGYK